MDTHVRDWIRLSLAFGVGNGDAWKYIDKASPSDGRSKIFSGEIVLNSMYSASFRSVSDEQTDAILRECKNNGIEVITPESEKYPQCFMNLYSPPLALYSLGDLSCANDMRSAAIVGARKCSAYSRAVTRYFSIELAKEDICIVSGFAKGVDTAAHSGALSAGGKTIAVIGCGILHDYPQMTMPFKQDIARNGAVISEYPPSAEPKPEYFTVRNRLIAALGDCVLVTQASNRSGALNTVSHALELGKDVFVTPPQDIFKKDYAGQSDLLRDGAELALSPRDLIEYISYLHTDVYERIMTGLSQVLEYQNGGQTARTETVSDDTTQD